VKRKFPFITDNYYHVYNRGIEKRIVYPNDSFYSRFLSILQHYLEYNYPYSGFRRSFDQAQSLEDKQDVLRGFRLKRLDRPPVEIISFCLMPNHYHLALKQLVTGGITNYMHRVGTSYTNYFNLRYERSGNLFQGKFKAVHVEREDQLLHLSRYHHLNPQGIGIRSKKELIDYAWSSLRDYINPSKSSLVNTGVVLSSFARKGSYLDFVFAIIDEYEAVRLEGLSLDDDFNWFREFRELNEEWKQSLREKYLETLL